jgi:hypothetical protein
MRLSAYYLSQTWLAMVVLAAACGCGEKADSASHEAAVGGSSSKSAATGGTSQSAAAGASAAVGGNSVPVSTGGNSVGGAASGGTASGGAASGGTASGGAATGGAPVTAGRGATPGGATSVATTTGGASLGGAAGAIQGGATGNSTTGGRATTGGGTSGGASAGGTSTAGTASGGTRAPSGGIGVTAGAAGTPAADNSFIVQSPSGIVDKLDILFAIDNSLSMGDKQQVLAAAVPQLLRRLTNPDCVDPNPVTSVAPVQMADPVASCPTGMEREFAPINDIHIGVVTSALGDFGGDTCPEDGAQNTAQNDHAWLVGALTRTNGSLPNFLGWTKANAADYAASIQAKLAEFKNHVAAATELGCGYEMTLEAWYRFLIDPKPPTDVTTTNSAANVRGPVDSSILGQRKAFLRPDSMVALVMLSDENDCSMRDDTYSWVAMTAGAGFRMWRGSSVCATNPNDPCCYSCMFDSFASDECKALDTTCRQADPAAKVSAAADDVNLRCRSMKKRFGFDFLFPATRYVNALTKLQLCPDQTYGDLDWDCTAAKAKGVACTPGAAVANPLYQNLDSSYVPTGPVRLDASSVFLAGVVGVPWQDLAVDGALSATVPLKYRLASELNWDLFAPKDDVTPPLDPLMLEQTAPRTGTQPITKEPLAPPTAARLANSINGHEWNTSDKDVQFACIFSLDQPIIAGQPNALRVCDLATACGADDGSDAYRICARRFDGCACTLSPAGATQKGPLDPTVSLSPLCQAGDGQYGSTQFFAKAYPGLRELQVLRGFFGISTYSRNNAIAASICPKDLNAANAAGPGYGYNPAMRALVDRLKDNIGGTCLPQPLVADATTGKVPCALIEAITPEGAAEGSCDCAAKQRDAVDATTQQSMRALLERRGTCVGTSCNNFCFCRLRQLLPGTTAGDACLNDLNATRTTNPPGFCYVDPPNHGNAALVADCDAGEKRTLRIVGNTALGLGAPAKGPVFYTCSATPFASGATTP